jgi:hypothetical protein
MLHTLCEVLSVTIMKLRVTTSYLLASTLCYPAGWLAKCGCLAESLELQFIVKDAGREQAALCASQKEWRSTIELAVAAALEKAAAAAASNSTGGLRIQSCKLLQAGTDCTAILQALPGSTLTSLHMDMGFCCKDVDAEEVEAMMGRLAAVLPSLHQLRQLHLDDMTYFEHEVSYDAVPAGFGALTNLTQLLLPMVR